MRLGIGSLVLGVGVEIVATLLPLVWETPPKWLVLTLISIGGLTIMLGLAIVLPIPNPLRLVRRAKQPLAIETRTRAYQDNPRRKDAVLNITNETGAERVENCSVRIRRLQWSDDIGEDNPRITEDSDYYLGWNARGDDPRYQSFATNAILDVAFITRGNSFFDLNTTDGIPFNVSIQSEWMLRLEFSADNVKPFEKQFLLNVYTSPANLANPDLPCEIDFYEMSSNGS